MKELLKVPVRRTPLTVVSGITFAQVPYWFPHYPSRDLKLDLIRPFGRPAERQPLIVWLCGGGFITMDRAAHLPWLTEFAKLGFAVASVEYRRSNSAKFPGALEDVKAAIRYLRARADVYGIDTEHVAVMGESAGAYLACMTGVTSGMTKYDAGEHLDQSSAVSAVIDIYGPTSFLSVPRDDERIPAALRGPSVTDVFLGYEAAREPERAREASVVDNVTEQTPPFFITHGTEDPIVPIAHSEALYERLRSCGVRADYYPVEGASHMGAEFYQDEMLDRMVSFLRSVWEGGTV